MQPSKGSPQNPMTYEELERQFMSLASRVMPEEQASTPATTVRELEKNSDLRELTALLISPTKGGRFVSRLVCRSVADELWSMLRVWASKRCYRIVGDALNPVVTRFTRAEKRSSCTSATRLGRSQRSGSPASPLRMTLGS